MKKLVLAVMVVLLAGPCFAQQDSHYKAAETFLDTIKVPDQMQQGVQSYLNMIASQNPDFDKYKDIFEGYFSKYLSWTAVKDEVIKVYMEQFSEDDLKKLTEFFKSDIGQQYITKNPIIMQKTVAIEDKINQEHAQELNDQITARQKELQPAEPAKEPAAAPTKK